MARRKRRTATRSSVVRRRAGKKSFQIKVSSTVAREILGIVFLCLGILVILSLYGSLGVIGSFFIGALSPVLGFGINIVPAMLFFIAGMLFFSKKVAFGPARILGVIFFMISVLSLIHLSVPIDEIYEYAAAGRYGGYVGFVTNFVFIEVLGMGRIGATTIFLGAFLVSLLLMFDLSLRDIARLIIPNVKFEIVKGGEGRQRLSSRTKFDDSEEEADDYGDAPEIMIHRAKIRGGDRDIDEVIKGEDDGGLKINKEVEQELKEELNDKAVEHEVSETLDWEFPSLDLLKDGDSNVTIDEKQLVKSAEQIKDKLKQFGINVAMQEVNVGPTVVQYTLKPSEGVKLSKITGLKNDLALALAAERIRIEAPIPGKSLVGIEVPNQYRAVVHLREIMESGVFTDSVSKMTLPLGRDVSGKPIIGNLETMPHLLIAGATGSGKSVCMNSFLISLLYQNSPQDLKFIMIDPKRVELSSYNNIPHLLTPVITDPEKAAISLRWVVAEMSRRYGELSTNRVRNIFEYNELEGVGKMPSIIVVIDELADLMMVASKEVEASICRIAQMARAVGIHLIVATQRPSVDVITGLIKANIPSRIAFAVSSGIDSRTILDGSGAEDLVGRGDMLYLPTGKNKPVRVQGIYVSTQEIERVTNRLKLTFEPNYNESIISTKTANESLNGIPDSKAGASDDALYEQAFQLVQETRKASASLFQRRLKVGYARAARLIDLLEENGVVGPAKGAKPRKIMIEE
ncbi:cell division protein FtsK [Candidatus Peregrinibacteria bacterium HGW-Peregrinibacteria-1]|jgi:S-DNA-T family DNA segregation ATPase FtsK/SpoIIIE|nr:MAG: cell division protein FtsK [Candidatus Peregrinibacteria bacterium HGW-Peregrinibacteria-1]